MKPQLNSPMLKETDYALLKVNLPNPKLIKLCILGSVWEYIS